MCDFQGNMVQAMVLIIQVTDLMAAMDLMDRMLLPIAGPTEVLSFFFLCLKLTGIVDGNLFSYYESSTGAPNTFWTL